MTKQGEKLGTQWVRNHEGDFFMGMNEDSEGRPIIDCTTLPPDSKPSQQKWWRSRGRKWRSQERWLKKEKNEEALVAALDVKVLHKRVGHLGKVGMERLDREGLDKGLEGGQAREMEMCEGCELSRPQPHHHRLVDLSHRSTRPLELVYADLAGPIRVQSWGGSKFMFVPVRLRQKSWVMLLKNKAEAGDRLKEWKALVENERGLKLGRLRTDNGGEFTSAALCTWLKEKGVNQEFTPSRTPQANGVAKRMNRTLQKMARSMMQSTGFGGRS